MDSKVSVKYQGVSKATYYRRLKEWTMTLYDKDGNPYIVNPKFVMRKDDENNKKSKVGTAKS